jgi:CubicO group peptidase (beta-lactamase class C family)
MKTKFLILIIACMPVGYLHAQGNITQIDSLLTKLHNTEGFDGNVLVADKGHIIYKKSFGYSNAETKTPLTSNTIFNLASVSKVFTAVAILKLVEQGRLKLTDDIKEYFPGMPYEGITIYHLLTHTSGLEDYFADPVRKYLANKPDNAAIVNAYIKAALKPKFAPGSNWSYSNTNFLLLASVIEKVSGLTYPEFMKKYIFRPAKMKHSFVLEKNAPAKLKGHITSVYYYPDFFALKPVNVDSIPFAKKYYALADNSYGDGGIFSTTTDLFRFHQALQHDKILNKNTLQLMYTGTRLPKGKTYEAGNANADFNSQYGLGWLVAIDSSIGKIAWHSGANPGTLTFFMRNISKDQCVIVLNNNWYRGSYHLGGSLMNLLNNRRVQLLAPSLARKIGQEYTLHGADAALKLLDTLKRTMYCHIGFLEMNELGYDLLAKNDTRSAIEVFKVNTEVYPGSGDVWDSLAEAYYKAGDLDNAIKDYEKSITLNPGNETGKKMLEKIREEISKGHK